MNSEELEQSLKMEFETFLKGVHHQMRQDVSEFQARIEAEFEKHRAQINEAFQAFAQRFDSKAGFDEAFASSVAEHLRLARDEGAKVAAQALAEAENLRESEVPAAAAEPAKYDAIRDAITDISSKDSQSAILKSLVEHATNFAGRGAFFIVKNDQLAGWKVFGDAGDAENSIREVHFPVANDSMLGEAVRSLHTVDSGRSGDSAFMGPLGFESHGDMYAVPLVARGRGVAVLYADGGSNGTVNREAIESMVRVASLTVELLAASSSSPHAETQTHFEHSSQPEQRHEPSAKETRFEDTIQHTPTFESAPAASDSGFSFSPGAADSSPFGAPAAHHEEPATPNFREEAPVYQPEPEPVTDNSGAMVFESGGSIESAEIADEPSPFERPAFAPSSPASPQAAPVGVAVEQGIEPVGGVVSTRPTSRLSDRAVDLPIEVPDEEKRLHNDARRFARLLVSEIKLYNEKKVMEGRQAYDLYDRLKEAIDRSREMYDKRVQPPVAARFDYFHYELVNALAEGNAERLGGDYPGATV
ncbi:MAG: hypothetical protein JO053_03220 [Acidobacteria bacterium]|nr:hypothetical protein [Acidobacteriota bacterium]